MPNCISLAKVVVAICAAFLLYLMFWGVPNGNPWQPSPLSKHGSLNGKVELTFRMGLFQKDIHNFFCSLLRSMVLFWSPQYGSVLIILDKEDIDKGFEPKIKSLRLPFRFRFVYEPSPDPKRFGDLAKFYGGKFGYLRQIYSSFWMDMYASAPVIGWIDTDVIFTLPVLEESITKDKKLIAKGLYSFFQPWVKDWDTSTRAAIGLPLVADFMTYFPVYVYASTVKNCRLYIMKKFGVKNFDDAFIKMHVLRLSPVNIIMSYAYYFEKDLYDWHISIGPVKLEQYNKDRLPKHPLLLKEVSPEPSLSVHIRYYQSPVYPLEQAICYTQIHLGVANMTHCQRFYGKANLQLYEFQNGMHPTFLQQWCHGPALKACVEIITQRYKTIVEVYEEGELALNVNLVGIVEQLASKEYKQNCPKITYIPFPEIHGKPSVKKLRASRR